ncbi:hypothetical protein D3C73_1372370 [compost metagenome]
MHFDGAGTTTVGTGPGDYQPGQIEQRITDGRQFPIDYRGQLAAVMPEHDVGQVKVAMLDTGLKLLRAMIAQPVGQAFQFWQAARARPTWVVFDAVQLRQPT